MTVAAAGNSVGQAYVPSVYDRPLVFDRWGGGAGTTQVMYSPDNGATMYPITVGGLPWANYTTDVGAEEVTTPTVHGRSYYVVMTGIVGTVNWNLSQ